MTNETQLPVWPAIICDGGELNFLSTKEDWFNDPDLCFMGNWGDTAFLIDAKQRKFVIKRVAGERTPQYDLTRTEEILSREKVVELVHEFLTLGKTNPETFDEAVAGVPEDRLVATVVEYFCRIDEEREAAIHKGRRRLVYWLDPLRIIFLLGASIVRPVAWLFEKKQR